MMVDCETDKNEMVDCETDIIDEMVDEMVDCETDKMVDCKMIISVSQVTMS